MFNLLMSGNGWKPDRQVFMGSRIFEHTSEDLVRQFSSESGLDLPALLRLPTLFASETQYNDKQEPARVGTLINVVRHGRGDYMLGYIFDPQIPPIPNSVLKDVALSLGITDMEFSRTHWAVKEADLFQTLYRSYLVSRPQPKVFKVSETPANQDLVAVMMPFGAEFKPTYSALQKAATDAGMQCTRVDEIWSNDHIVQDIVDLIARARVVICDLSGRNANVFYELGLAHTLGKDVIMITQSPSDVPFDVQGIRYIRYLPNREGRTALSQEVVGRLQTLKARR